MAGVYVLLLCVGIIVTDVKGDSVREVLDQLVVRYDTSEVPKPQSGGGLPVSIAMYINNFYGISSKHMEFSMSFYLRQKWQDDKLQFSEADMGASNVRAYDGYWDKIWTPDLFFRNEKDAHTVDILSDQRLLKVKSDGVMWYVVKYTATFSCPMRLHKFPFDTQKCGVMVESFGNTMDKMFLRWMETTSTISEIITVDRSVHLPGFTLTDVIIDDCSQNYSVGAFPCLEAQFLLARDTGYYVMVVFIPSALLVVISWIQFFLEPSAVTGRVLVGLFCSFTLVAQMTGLRSSLPEVSYVTSLDIWMFVCLLFTFSSLLQLVAVQMFGAKEGDDGEEKSKKKTNRIDLISRIAFPALFAFFCIIYVPVAAA